MALTLDRGYIEEHRIVYEESRKCCLLPKTVIHHIDGKRANNVWYNLQPLNHAQHSAIENTGNTVMLGRKHSEETKRKIGKSNIGKHNNKYWLGKHLSEETKKKISQYRRGRKLSQAHKDAIARGLKRRSTQGVIIGNE